MLGRFDGLFHLHKIEEIEGHWLMKLQIKPR
jgi:hypothetical protein